MDYLYHRHTSVVEWMNKNHGYRRYSDGGYPYWGASQTEREVEQFKWAVQTYKPRVAVSMTPFGLDMEDRMRNQVCIADGAQHGDVLASVWQIGTMNLAPITCLVEEPVNQPLCAIQDRYRIGGLNPVGDGRGVVDIQETPHCIGLEVWISLEVGCRKLSLNSHIKTRRLNGLRTR